MAFVGGMSPSPYPSTRLRKLEFALFKKSAGLVAGARVFVSVSGGADSVALLSVLDRLKSRRAGFSLEVVHVHHGDSDDAKQQRYRDRAEKKVTQLAKSLGLPVHVLRIERAASALDSEDAFREARYRATEKAIVKLSAGNGGGSRVLVAMAHHSDDLFETRLIRLLRGTGPDGLRAMTEFSHSEGKLEIWRPFLTTSRQEILEYLEDLGFRKHRDWVEDPSNRDARYLRNSLRRGLIPMIEKTRQGGVRAMARSLELLVEACAQSVDTTSTRERLERGKLLALPPLERRKQFSQWARRQGIRDLSKSQIEEILRRIDTPQKRLSFEIGGRVWSVASLIEASGIETSD